MWIRIGLILGLAWLTGLGLGLILPRFTTIVGTSLLGVLGVAIGVVLLVPPYGSGFWPTVENHAPWFLCSLGVVLLASLVYQFRQGRPASAPPVPA